nr:hypothetical protein Itr_chr10CG17240 [Ipomoea trifida]
MCSFSPLICINNGYLKSVNQDSQMDIWERECMEFIGIGEAELYDKHNQVIADRDYTPGDQMVYFLDLQNELMTCDCNAYLRTSSNEFHFSQSHILALFTSLVCTDGRESKHSNGRSQATDPSLPLIPTDIEFGSWESVRKEIISENQIPRHHSNEAVRHNDHIDHSVTLFDEQPSLTPAGHLEQLPSEGNSSDTYIEQSQCEEQLVDDHIDIQQPRRSTRTRALPNRLQDYIWHSSMMNSDENRTSPHSITKSHSLALFTSLVCTDFLNTKHSEDLIHNMA